MIVVTGATGHFGRLVVEGLLQKVPATQIGVSVRDPKKAADLEQRGVRVRAGDFADPSTLQAAFDGAEQVLLVSVNKFGEDAVRQHANAIHAAKQAGVKRILYTSHQGAGANAKFVPSRDHAATEALMQASGIPYVSLRNGFYAESALYQLGSVKSEGKIVVPEDGPMSWTTRGDLAEAAVAALTAPRLFDGISPPLTNTDTLDFQDIAAVASTILSRPIVRITVSDAAYRAGMISHGVPEEMADALGTLYTASRAREFNVVDPTLATVLGRKPTSLETLLTGFFSASKSASAQH